MTHSYKSLLHVQDDDGDGDGTPTVTRDQVSKFFDLINFEQNTMVVRGRCDGLSYCRYVWSS